MTVADYIRSLTDEGLAKFFYTLLHERDLLVTKQLTEQGIQNSLISMPGVSIAKHLKYLQSPFYNNNEEEK